MKEAGDFARAKETVVARQQELEELGMVEVRPLKKDIAVGLVSLAWVPHWQDAQGTRTPAWK